MRVHAGVMSCIPDMRIDMSSRRVVRLLSAREKLVIPGDASRSLGVETGGLG